MRLRSDAVLTMHGPRWDEMETCRDCGDLADVSSQRVTGHTLDASRRWYLRAVRCVCGRTEQWVETGREVHDE